MGPSAKSRKGKKAWRKNIDAAEVEDFIGEQTYQERRGPAAKDLKDDQLFFVDTSADVDAALAAADGKRPSKRQRSDGEAGEEGGKKKKVMPLTRAQQIIAEAHKARPVALAPAPRKPAAATAAGAGTKGGKLSGALVVASGSKRPGKGSQGAQESHPLDLWADEDLGATPGPGSEAAAKQQQQKGSRKQQRKEKKLLAGASGASGAGTGPTLLRVMGPSVKPLRKSPPPQRLPAVPVDLPGCSYNPDHEHHQDALALLVAAEMKKELKKELAPAAPPLHVEGAEGGPRSELEALQVEADESDEEEQEQQQEAGGAAADPNAISLGGGIDSEDEGEDGAGGQRKREQRKKSKKDRNREARRKAQEAELEAKRRLKAQRRELQSLADVEEQLRQELEEKEARRERLQSIRQERAVVLPPRLGKLKFEPPTVQVLTSDEKTGSLRQIKPCAMLAADRFKSLQQRGLLEPRKPQAFKEKRRKVTYEKGGRFEKAAAASDEVRELTRKNKKARRQAKAAAAAAAADEAWM